MSISIRKVREEDAAAIVELLNPIIEAGTYTAMDEPVTLESQREFIRGFPQRGIFLAAEDETNGRILGIQDVAPGPELEPVGEISTFVRLDALRCGVGRALTEATCLKARERGFLGISATIRADNAGALAFYESQGFARIGTPETDAEEVLMEKHLQAR